MAQAGHQQNSTKSPLYSDSNLIWVDLEMTGLNPDEHKIIELALVVTTAQLDVIAQAPVYAIHQPAQELSKMDAWNKAVHGKSGLIDRVRTSTWTEEQVEDEVISFLKAYVPKGKAPMCGNTIGQDRRFMFKSMPRLEEYFHYRSIDVSTIKELARRWKPELLKGFQKKQQHTALADILESIEELKYYRAHFMKY